MPLSWPTNMPLRSWQESAYNKWLLHQQRDFLTVATPGAGKTRFALYIASESLRLHKVQRVVIVCPTQHLKLQWATEAAKVGIDIDPEMRNGDGTHGLDYHGVAVTYMQVGNQPAIYRKLCADRPTLVIFDEIHHAGEDRNWGDGAREGFEFSPRRLLLSGTPFRQDNRPIPFVRYNTEGRSQADYAYTYADALRDNVCRPVFFPTYEGEMTWYARGRKREATFADKLAEDEKAKRLLTALDPNGDWIRTVIRDADAKLTMVRDTHANAGGLCIAKDKAHADRLAGVFHEITGRLPLVVTSDDANAKESIEQFSRSNDRWVIAVKMISEGTDISRLRVGIYATNIKTEMFFRQAVGRFVRMVDGVEDQYAYVFLPRDEDLVDFAQAIKEERDHQLKEECDKATQEREGCGDDKVLSLFVAVSSDAKPHDVLSDGDTISQAEIIEADQMRQTYGAAIDPAVLAMIVRDVRRKAGHTSVRAEAHVSEGQRVTLKRDQKDQLSKIIRRLVAQVVEMEDGLEWSYVYETLNRRDGLVNQRLATLDQLKGRIEFLEAWVGRLRNGR